MRQTLTLFALSLGAVFALPLSASAHEMFLKPAQFELAPGAKTTIALFNGTIDKSENPISRDRMTSVMVVGAGGSSAPDPAQWRDDKATSYLDLTVGGPGSYVVGVSTAPRIIELSADNFEEYLLHDGIEDTLKARQAANVPRTPVKERYSKHVKTIVQVGGAQTDDYARPLGFPAEILLGKNPAAVKVGDTPRLPGADQGPAHGGPAGLRQLRRLQGLGARRSDATGCPPAHRRNRQGRLPGHPARALVHHPDQHAARDR
ncbi:DUF4198 domain-containing protein [Phenylobacterium sp. J367]|nr:DUF4198 domain-containing protein [Phenylobacterium sp. J367]MCR5877298.1 DUF4198 domain-containing protein [Phenylobacterium sp. J367]